MKNISLLGLLVFASTVSAQGLVLQVPLEYSTIQSAIDVASPGDTVEVSPGEYEENIDFLGKDIVLTSLDPLDPNTVATTIIFREPQRSRRGLAYATVGNGSIVTFTQGETERAVLTGFTIKYGYGTRLEGNEYYGGGILCNEASPTITRNVITENFGEEGENQQGSTNCFGGAICCLSSNAFVAYNTISHNTGFIGTGIFAVEGQAVIYSNLILNNTAYAGGAIYLTGGTFINNTLVDNVASFVGGHIVVEAGAPYIAGNIIYGGKGGGVLIQNLTDGDWFVHNDLFDNQPADFISYDGIVTQGTVLPIPGLTGQLGNISEDPLFVDVSQGDYRLQDDSLCIDAGDPTFEPNLLWVDMAGNPRISGALVDIGAFESTSCTSPVAHAGPDQIVLINEEVTLDGSTSVFCDPNSLQMFIWDQSAGPSVRLSNPRSDQPSFTPDLAGEYYFELMVFDGDNVSMADEVVVTVVAQMPAD